MQQRIWIVGASSGIGLELVKLWLKQGVCVVASARSATRTKALMYLKERYPLQLHTVDIDVTSIDSVSKAVREAWKSFNGLDVWFYNAAVYEVMPIQAWDVNHFESMMQVNYLGAIKIMCKLIPYFDEQKHGQWVWNASLSSYFGLPLGGGYSASKAALANLAESLQPELKAKGIKLQLINHGFVQTRLTQKNTFEMPELMSPQTAAKNIIKAMQKTYRFESHFPFRLSFFLRVLRLLPYSLSLALTNKMLPK